MFTAIGALLGLFIDIMLVLAIICFIIALPFIAIVKIIEAIKN